MVERSTSCERRRGPVWVFAVTMVRLGMAPRLPSLTPEAFQRHWSTAHADTAGRMSGIRRYEQNHAVLVSGQTVLPYPGFDACAEIEFADLSSHDAAFASAHYQQQVRDDEDRFVDKSRFSWVLTEPAGMLDRGIGDDPVKLLVLWRAHPVGGMAGLRRGSDRWAAMIGADDLVRRHVQLRVRHDWHEGRPLPACDHVDVLWFDGVDAARRHATSAGPAALAMAGAAFGYVQHLAKPRRVV